MPKLRFIFMDGTEQIREIEEPSKLFILHKDKIQSGVKYIDIMPDFFTAEAGDDGFMLIPCYEGSHYSAQTFFRQRDKL